MDKARRSVSCNPPLYRSTDVSLVTQRTIHLQYQSRAQAASSGATGSSSGGPTISHNDHDRYSAVIRFLLATLLAVQGTVAACREMPLWEAGIGLFPSTFPAYRGSEDQQYHLLPFPYPVYRSDFLR